MVSRRYHPICHPRYIEEKAQELVSFLDKTDPYLYRSAQDIARIIFAAGNSRLSHTRTIALIAHAVVKELFWRNSHWCLDFVNQLVDLTVSQFIANWTDELDRVSEVSETDVGIYESSEGSSDEDDLLFRASNPRLDEYTYSALYDEDCDYSDDKHITHIAGTGQTIPEIRITYASPTLSATYEIEGPKHKMDYIDEVNTPLLAATIILGDFFAMGLIPVQTMQASVLHLAENLTNADDGHLLYTLLTRAASHVAPRLGLLFLEQCQAYILKNQKIMETNEYHGRDILKAINELIICESNNESYSHLACHRWDSTLPADISLGS